MSTPVRTVEIDTLGDLGAALEAHFGSGLEAVLIVRRLVPGEALTRRRWSEPLELPQPADVLRPVCERIVAFAGVPPHLLGYGAFVECLVAIGAGPGLARHLSAEVYPRVGERIHASAPGVERAIRYALVVAAAQQPARFAAAMGPAVREGRTPTVVAALSRLLRLVADDLRGGGPA